MLKLVICNVIIILSEMVCSFFTTPSLSQWSSTLDCNYSLKKLQYSSRKIKTDNTPNISALGELMFYISPKSWLCTDIMPFPSSVAIIHAPPDLLVDSLPSVAMMRLSFLTI